MPMSDKRYLASRRVVNQLALVNRRPFGQSTTVVRGHEEAIEYKKPAVK